MSRAFTDQVAWAVNNGAHLSDKIERRIENGVAGFFATDNIDKGALLARIPKSLCVPIDDVSVPKNTSRTVHQIYSAALSLYSREHEHHAATLMLEDLESFKQFSTYFCSDKELTVLQELNPILAHEIRVQNAETEQIVDALKHFDASLSKDIYLTCVLNFKSRAIGDNGFVPIAECFNHSVDKGEYFDSSGENVVLKSKQAYRQGEQVYMSYGKLDMYAHAINYNYYDAQDEHFMSLEKRFTFPIHSPMEKALAQSLSHAFPIKILRTNSQHAYKISDPSAHFEESKPSPRLWQLALHASATLGTATSASAQQYLNSLIANLDKANHVDQYAERYVPQRIRRFYHLLSKEKQMIANNKKSLTTLHFLDTDLYSS